MRIFITGATGMIGRRLVADRLAGGDGLVALSRDADRAKTNPRKLKNYLSNNVFWLKGSRCYSINIA